MSTHETFLRIKAVERAGERFIEGWATTPAKDLALDVVLPEGAQFTLPIPLLFAHSHLDPIGVVTEARVTKAGIRVKAKLTAGVAKAEEIWKLILDGALTACSIGFSGLKTTPLSGGGLRFDSWLWHELSICAVGMNPDARISVAKCAAYSPKAEPVKAEPVYVPHLNVAKDFESAARCLPGLPVSPTRSYKTGKAWQLCDNSGALLGIVAEPEAKAVHTAVRSTASNPQAVTFKALEHYSKELGKVLGIMRDELETRIAELESTVSGQRATINALTTGVMKYAGDYQEPLAYPRGAVVRHSSALFFAIKDIQPGKALPNRQGSGWARLTD